MSHVRSVESAHSLDSEEAARRSAIEARAAISRALIGRLSVNLRSQIGRGHRRLDRAWKAATMPAVVAVAIGFVLLVWPDVTALISLWGAFALAAGLGAALIGTFTTPISTGSQGWRIVEGALGVAVGVLALLRPGLSAQSLIYAIAAWAIAAGLLELVMARRYWPAA